MNEPQLTPEMEKTLRSQVIDLTTPERYSAISRWC
jgi:hypothetical protein